MKKKERIAELERHAWCAVAEQVDHVCWGNDVELMNKAACRRYGLTRTGRGTYRFTGR